MYGIAIVRVDLVVIREIAEEEKSEMYGKRYLDALSTFYVMWYLVP